jgi:hypothetical protein
MIAEVEGVDIMYDAMLLAKVNDETRGIAYPQEVNGKMLFFMPVYADREKENVKFFIEQNGVETALAETIIFNTNDIRGNTGQPFPLKVKGSNSPYVNVDAQEISISPNPVTDKFVVHTNLNSDITLEIVDMLGRVAYSQKGFCDRQISVNGREIAGLPSGTYLVKIICPQSVLVSKIIKK